MDGCGKRAGIYYCDLWWHSREHPRNYELDEDVSVADVIVWVRAGRGDDRPRRAEARLIFQPVHGPPRQSKVELQLIRAGDCLPDGDQCILSCSNSTTRPYFAWDGCHYQLPAGAIEPQLAAPSSSGTTPSLYLCYIMFPDPGNYELSFDFYVGTSHEQSMKLQYCKYQCRESSTTNCTGWVRQNGLPCTECVLRSMLRHPIAGE